MDSQTNALFDNETVPTPKYGLNELIFNATNSPKLQRPLHKSSSVKKFLVLSAKDERSFLTPSSSFTLKQNSTKLLRTNETTLAFSSPNMLKSNPNLQHIVRSGSYMFNENGNSAKLFSDATSIKSLVSIGMGSTDGRKMVIRKVPNSPSELLSCINPQTPPEDIYENESYDFSNEDEGDGVKPRRQYWSNKMHFVLACIGYSVGLSNVFRFPYIMYKSGGGVFLLPYLITLMLCGIPILFMELAIGQFTGRGAIKTIGQLCPLLKGSGLASVIVSFFMSTYYSVVIGYSIFYFFTSFRTHLPWMDCSSVRWNTLDCWNMEMMISNSSTRPVNPQTPSEEFFQNKVLQMSEGLEYPGGMRWDLVACLVCAWILVYFAIWKSIKSSTKIRYFTASFPYVLIALCMGRALTLEGADKGLQFFFHLNWIKLKEANVWINAASQSFNSLGLAFGAMISFASFNKYNNNVLHDALAVSSVNIITSMLVGVLSFATIGNIAYEKGLPIDQIIEDGPGLIFVVYPQLLARMPSPQLWSVLFFFMLLCLGLNSQFAIVEVVVTSIQDGFPNWIKTKLVYHELLVLIVCIFAFFFGLPNIIQGGIYYFQLIDHYVATITILFVAFFQIIAISWFYGIDRLSRNIKDMTGKDPSIYFRFCWLITAPLILAGIFVLALVNYKPLTYQNGSYEYPLWAHIIGWSITGATLSCIPVFAIFNLYHAEGPNIKTRYKHSLRPNIYECKLCHEHNCDHIEDQDEDFHLFPITLQPPPLINAKEKNQNRIVENENIENSDQEKATSSKSQNVQ